MNEPGYHRATILQSIRSALGAQLSSRAIAEEYAAIPRNYTRMGDKNEPTLVEILEGRLREYDAGVYHAQPQEISTRISEILTLRKKQALVIPHGIPHDWLPGGFTFFQATGNNIDEINKADGVLCACTVAIAETGTVVLQNVPGQGARILSLVPDYHLCLVFSTQVVLTVPEAFTQLKNTANLPTTFISGPSATADIEMTRIKGVHGPRFFDVLIVTQ